MTTTGSHRFNIAPFKRAKTRPRSNGFAAALLAGLVFFSGALWAAPAAFTIGKLSDDPVKQLKRLNQMADALAESMAQFGYLKGDEAVYRRVEDARAALISGELDLITTTLFEAAQLMQSGDAVPLAVKWKKESPRYAALIIVRKGSGIESLADLAGKLIAFEDPLSTSGYFLPARAIHQAGLTLEQATGQNSPDAVRYRFSGSEQNSSALLFRGSVEAIALSDHDWLKSDHLPLNQRAEFDIIHVSDSFPRAIELVRATMPETEKQALLGVLLGMHLDPMRKDALRDYHDTSRFSALSADDLQQLAEVVDYVRAGAASRED